MNYLDVDFTSKLSGVRCSVGVLAKEGKSFTCSADEP